VDVMEALGDPVRRRLVELLADGTRSAGDLAAAVGDEFGISQPATSRHLRVLREAGVVESQAQGPVRLYAVRPEPLDEVERWVRTVRRYWEPRLDALGTEVARGKRARRLAADGADDDSADDDDADGRADDRAGVHAGSTDERRTT
jgi:DNA-binding transcriptional ArsR family regulator